MLLTEEQAREKWPVLGRKRKHSKGYIRILSPTHPNADADGYVYEHIYMASRVLGRGLKKGETAHHIYGVPADNRNLVICSHAYHRQLHERLARSAEWPQFSTKKRDNRPRCIVCGSHTNYGGKTPYCVEHYWQHARIQFEVCRVKGCGVRAGARSGLCLSHLNFRSNKRRYAPSWEFPEC